MRVKKLGCESKLWTFSGGGGDLFVHCSSCCSNQVIQWILEWQMSQDSHRRVIVSLKVRKLTAKINTFSTHGIQPCKFSLWSDNNLCLSPFVSVLFVICTRIEPAWRILTRAQCANFCTTNLIVRHLSTNMSIFQVYWVGPLLGGIIGGFTYEYTHDSSGKLTTLRRSFRRRPPSSSRSPASTPAGLKRTRR